jgi:hypothetical protein
MPSRIVVLMSQIFSFPFKVKWCGKVVGTYTSLKIVRLIFNFPFKVKWLRGKVVGICIRLKIVRLDF